MCNIKAPNGRVQSADEASAAFPGQQPGSGSAGCRPPLAQALDRGLASQLPARGTKKGMLRAATWHHTLRHQVCQTAELGLHRHLKTRACRKVLQKDETQEQFIDRLSQLNTFVSDSSSVHHHPPHVLTASISGIPSMGRALTFWNESRGGHQADEAFLLRGKAERIRIVQSVEREGLGVT